MANGIFCADCKFYVLRGEGTVSESKACMADRGVSVAFVRAPGGLCGPKGVMFERGLL